MLHEPRVVIKDYIAEDLPKEFGARCGAGETGAPISTVLSAATSPRAAAPRRGSHRMFANDQGWSHKLHEAVGTG